MRGFTRRLQGLVRAAGRGARPPPPAGGAIVGTFVCKAYVAFRMRSVTNVWFLRDFGVSAWFVVLSWMPAMHASRC